jgi:hypothetical protein
MNRLSIVSVAVTLGIVAGVSAALPLSVSADSTTNCTVTATGKKNTAGNSDSRFTLNGNMATAQVTVTGTDCNEPVTIVSWQAPDALKGQPYSAQKLFAHNTATLTSGTHNMSVELPDCFYQVDVVRGTSATDSKGGPEYKPNGGIQILGSLHGGTKACETGGGGGSTPTPPSTPVVESTTTTLPNTGSGSTGIVLAIISTVVGAFAWNRRQLRKLNA